MRRYDKAKIIELGIVSLHSYLLFSAGSLNIMQKLVLLSRWSFLSFGWSGLVWLSGISGVWFVHVYMWFLLLICLDDYAGSGFLV